MLLSSGYGFSHLKAKTSDHFFTGSRRTGTSWCCICSAAAVADMNALILLGFAAMVFVPIRYIYPSRTTVCRWPPTCSAGVGGDDPRHLWQYPQVSRGLVLASLAYPVYYFALSFVVHTPHSGRPEGLQPRTTEWSRSPSTRTTRADDRRRQLDLAPQGARDHARRRRHRRRRAPRRRGEALAGRRWRRCW
jgi:hypothetical protein